MERVLDLTLKLADEGLSPDEQGELERLIEAEPLARRRHLQMLEVEAALRSARHAKSPERLLTTPSSSLIEERRVAAVLQEIRRPARFFSWRRGNRLRTTAVVTALAAAALALLVWTPRRRPVGQAGVMAHTAAQGPAARHELPAPAGRRGWSVAVLPVQAASPADHVELDLGDSARLEVRGRAVLGIERSALVAEDGTASRVTLEEGTVSYHRPAGQSAQTAISTPHASVLARAARLLVVVTAQDTRVNVIEGNATVTLHSEGGTTPIGARHTALVSGGRATVMPLPSALLIVGGGEAQVPAQFIDQRLGRRLETLGFAVEVVGERELRAEHLHHRGLVLISPTVTGRMHDRAVEMSLFAAPVPILCSRPALYQDLGMTAPGRSNGEYSKQKRMVTIKDRTHPMAAGLRGEVEVLDATLTIGWGVPAASATRVALMRDNPDHAAIFAFERDAPLLAPAGRAAARRTGFFLHPIAARFMNEEAWQLFDAAVKWTAGDALE
jgi:hypothetical protein